MSKIVLLCCREPAAVETMEQMASVLSGRLLPDNICPRPPRVLTSPGLSVFVLNPSDTLPIEGESVCGGRFCEDSTGWAEPGGAIPDGSFALYRGSSDRVEIATDAVASRTIWYAKTKEVFVASSSQRAIVMLLGGFFPNEDVFAWMLSSGTLGPGNSWDRRVELLPPDARLVLDRQAWTLDLKLRPCEFRVARLGTRRHKQAMQAAVNDSLAGLALDCRQWVLPLSGGYDSRAILLGLRDRSHLKCVTWGSSASLADRTSDSAVATRLARRMELQHEFWPVECGTCPFAELFARFVALSEGRVDHIYGYLDGFAIWKRLFELGCSGTLRGDVGYPHLGAVPAVADDVRQNSSIGLLLLSDFANLAGCENFDLPRQELPEDWAIGPSETLATYRERLYHQFRMPLVLAALNEVKAGYGEIVSPFVTRRIIQQVRALPDRLRTDKKLFKSLVRGMSTDVAFATSAAIETASDVLQRNDAVQLMLNELESAPARQILPGSLLDFVLPALRQENRLAATAEPRRTARRSPGELLKAGGRRVRRLTRGPRPWGRPTLDIHELALRATIISRMCTLLRQDGEVLRRRANIEAGGRATQLQVAG